MAPNPLNKQKIHIAVLAHEFLINMGANDLLKNLLRALNTRDDVEVYFLVPDGADKAILSVPTKVKSIFRKNKKLIKFSKRLIRRHKYLFRQANSRSPNEYSFYVEACPRLIIVPCQATNIGITRVVKLFGIDVLLPSIHALDIEIPYITYWPDCQPKHFPEFFDDASQELRDEMINKLLDSRELMIVNSIDTKNDLVKFYKANLDQIYNLPFAPIVDFNVFQSMPELIDNLGLPEKYFLVSNQFWIHKSIQTVLFALAKCNEVGMKVTVIFTGRMEEPRRPDYITYLEELVANLNLESQVRFLGYVEKRTQLEIMKGCVAVIQPTLFEGGPGGGSVYDALGIGKRAIVSNIPVNMEIPKSYSEISFFNVGEPESLALEMIRVSQLENLSLSIEEMWKRSQQNRQILANRLYEAIEVSLRKNNE